MFFIAAFISLLPIQSMFTIGDKKISYKEWWSSGIGVEFFIISLIIGVGAICLIKKIKLARTVYLVAFAGAFLAMFFFEFNQPNSGEILISGLIPFVLIYWYLFHVNSVKQYFQ